jgi:hypothetical protein
VYEFRAMLDPAENYPVGSFEWAHRMAARLQGASDNVDRTTASNLRQIILEISDAKAWNVWPTPPAGTPEDFCQIVCGRSWEGLVNDVLYHTKDEKIARSMEYGLRLANARAQNENRKPGRPLQENHVQHMVLKQGTGQRAYNLRRLLRERPDLVARIESGGLSVNAAAIEAGFRKKLTPFETIVKLLPKLTRDERRKLQRLLVKQTD